MATLGLDACDFTMEQVLKCHSLLARHKIFDGPILAIAAMHTTNVLVTKQQQMKSKQLHLGGFYCSANAGWMASAVERHGDYHIDLTFINDPFTLLVNQDIKLDEELAQKMDFQRSIENYKQDGGVFRWSKYGIKAGKYNPKETEIEGGVGYHSPASEQQAEKAVIARYPDYVSHVKTHKDGGTLMVLKDRALPHAPAAPTAASATAAPATTPITTPTQPQQEHGFIPCNIFKDPLRFASQCTVHKTGYYDAKLSRRWCVAYTNKDMNFAVHDLSTLPPEEH